MLNSEEVVLDCYKKIDEWNTRVGNNKQYTSNYQCCTDITKQAWIVHEEVQETIGASKDTDLLETLDGVCDVLYTGLRLAQLLENRGVQVWSALKKVCENNDLKYTRSLATATQWLEDLSATKPFLAIHEYEGNAGTYYCVKDTQTGKVIKPVSHPKVDLSVYVEEFNDC